MTLEEVEKEIEIAHQKLKNMKEEDKGYREEKLKLIRLYKKWYSFQEFSKWSDKTS